MPSPCIIPVSRASAARASSPERNEGTDLGLARDRRVKDAQVGHPTCPDPGQQAQCTNLPWLCLADGLNLLPWVPDLRSAGQARRSLSGTRWQRLQNARDEGSGAIQFGRSQQTVRRPFLDDLSAIHEHDLARDVPRKGKL